MIPPAVTIRPASTTRARLIRHDGAISASRSIGTLPDGPDSIRLIWGITDGYYLYRSRIKASSDAPQAKLGELTLPQGETKIDEYFGKQEVYHRDIVGSIAVARSSSGELTVRVDGRPVFSYKDVKRQPQPGEVARLVKEAAR